MAPPNIKVSLLIFVNPPVPLITPSIRIPLTTSVVKVKLDKLIPPVSTNKESELVPDKVPLTMVDAEPNVMAPVHLLVFLVFFIAP